MAPLRQTGPVDLYTLDIDVTRIDGTPLSLRTYRGSALLVVNVASHCGFTPQYRELEALHRRWQPQGLVVMGFPCDQFGHQEPGDDRQIREFCTERFDVTFPMFSKVDVNGADAHPLYRFLKTQQGGVFGLQRIAWNFTKFLVDGNGSVVGRYGSRVSPKSIEPEIVKVLESRQ
ncbi:MAG: glutathione peroxidase [Vicinamibacterales bacterium]